MPSLEKSVYLMRAVCECNGSYYFEPETIKFFNSRVHFPANRWGLFVESFDSFNRQYRLYTVKFFSPYGKVTTIEPSEQSNTYEHFLTLEEAVLFRIKLTDALDEASKQPREGEVLKSLEKVVEEGFHSGIYELINACGKSIKINTNDFDRFICG